MICSRYGTVTDYLVPPKVENDDTAYPILVLHTLDEYGPSFTSEQLALEWVEHLPYAFTAEQVALENLKAGMMPPESGRFRNPCNEWIGAQMRGEIHGLLTPFRPDLAAELAFRDAIISHRREGVYGEIFCAALISIAFSGRPIEETLRLALSFVPPESHFHEVVEKTIQWCKEIGEWKGVLLKIEQELGHYHWIHTFPNIATAITGLLLGEGDFDRSLTTTLMCGFDTDCSAGQVGGFLGTLLGYESIPDKWRAPVGKEFESYVIGFEKMSFTKLSEWTVHWGKRIVGPVLYNA
jgi:ADP-ribosylglycohydrolase